MAGPGRAAARSGGAAGGDAILPGVPSRRLRVPSILLRLLLCLCLVANATGSAWAATTMAMPMPAAATMSTTMPCHMDAGMPAAAAQAHPDHAMPAPHGHAPAGCKAGSCDCLQHCGSALVLPALVLPAVPAAIALHGTVHASRGAPSPYRPVRPPIA